MYKITLVAKNTARAASFTKTLANVLNLSNVAATLQYTSTRVYITCATLQAAQQVAMLLLKTNAIFKMRTTKQAQVANAHVYCANSNAQLALL